MLKRVSGLVLLLVCMGGCSRNLYHYHRTVVGVDISGNVTGNAPSGHLTLGYSRRLVVVLPADIKDALAKPSTDESLPSTVFCTQVRASLGGVNVFREVLATGLPAQNYAMSLVAASDGLNDWQYRNYVCPGFEIPSPDNPQGVKAAVGALPPR